MSGEWRSLFDMGEYAIGRWVVRGEIAVLMLGEVGDRACGEVRGDRCLMLRFRRSGFVGDEGAIAV